MKRTIATPDTIDLRDVVASVRRGARWIPGGLVVGLAAAALVNQASHRYEAEATVVLQDRGSGGLSALGVSMMEGLPSSVGEALSLPSGFSGLAETEAAILQGQELLRAVTRELDLQLRVIRPRGLATNALFSSVSMDERASRGSFSFRSRGDVYEVRGTGGFEGEVSPGAALMIPGGEVRLRGDVALPDRFSVRVRSSWETVDEMTRRREIVVDNAGGALAEVSVRWTDAQTAAAIANALVGKYLQERRLRIRSLSDQRLQILGHVRDSLDTEVSGAADALRQFQLASGQFDPERLGDLERIAELRANVDLLEVEAGALENVLRDLEEGDGVSQADLLAFPSFLESEAINEILLRLTALRDQRAQLLERRTPSDPDVLVLERAIGNQEAELLELATSYRDGLEESLIQIEERLETYRLDLAGRPAFETEGLLLENRLEVSGATFIAVQTQVVRSRLESVSEGAELRQVDHAVTPMRPRFPRPKLNYALGLVAGTFGGLLFALVAGAVTAQVTDPKQVRKRLAIPVLSPLTESPVPEHLVDGRVMLVPVHGSTSVDEAHEYLEGLELGRVERCSVSRVRTNDRVVLSARIGERVLTRAEELIPDLEAAGATAVACVVLPRRRQA